MKSKPTHQETLKIGPTGEREVLITRRFDAPRRLVYDAHTKPELVQRWLRPPGWRLAVCEIDLRVGGSYRYVWQGDRDGQKMGVGGVYREIVAPERLVVTEKFDDAWYPGEAINTTTFEEKDGQTVLSLRLLYESQSVRDMVLKSGMETGLSASYEQLEELVSAP